MADSKVSVLNPLLGSALASGDLFYVVDISAGTAGSKRITKSELIIGLGIDQVNAAVQSALDGKVDENAAITGATKTKITYDAKGLITSGADATTADIAASTDKNYVTDAQLVVVGNTSGTNTGDNATNSQYSGLAASKQDTLVSATNIKTINGSSVLGSGNLSVSASPSGIAGSIQFSDGSAFVSDNANLFYDDTNNRLGVGINASLLGRVHIKGEGATGGTKSIVIQDSSVSAAQHFFVKDNGDVGNSPSSGTTWLLNSNGFSLSGTGSSKTVLYAGASGNAGIGTQTAHAFSIFTNNQTRGQVSLSGQWLFGPYSTSYNACALLEARSTTQGVLLPRLTTAQKDAISTPLAGLLVFDTTLGKLSIYNGSAFETVTSI